MSGQGLALPGRWEHLVRTNNIKIAKSVLTKVLIICKEELIQGSSTSENDRKCKCSAQPSLRLVALSRILGSALVASGFRK